MNGLWLAIGFLSRLPSRRAEFNPRALAGALFWFPAVGVLLGSSWFLSAKVIGAWLSPSLTSFLMLLVGVVFTGALHWDGLADTFDGFSAAGGGREKALDAMKDSRVGAHGAVALLMTAMAKLAAFQSLGAPALPLLTAAIVARWLAAIVVAYAKPARTTGLGATFGASDTRRARRAAWLGSVWLIVPAALAGLDVVRWFVFGISLSLGCVFALWFVRRCMNKFGGVTGDTHGALIELSETLALFVWAAGATT